MYDHTFVIIYNIYCKIKHNNSNMQRLSIKPTYLNKLSFYTDSKTIILPIVSRNDSTVHQYKSKTTIN